MIDLQISYKILKPMMDLSFSISFKSDSHMNRQHYLAREWIISRCFSSDCDKGCPDVYRRRSASVKCKGCGLPRAREDSLARTLLSRRLPCAFLTREERRRDGVKKEVRISARNAGATFTGLRCWHQGGGHLLLVGSVSGYHRGYPRPDSWLQGGRSGGGGDTR